MVGSSSTNTCDYAGIGYAVSLIMLVIAVVGIKITARVQVSMALVDYLILIGLAIAGLVYVLPPPSSDNGTMLVTVAQVLGGSFWARR